MHCLDDEFVMVELDMLVVVELDMLVVCCKQGRIFVMIEVGKMTKLGRRDVENIGNTVSGER